MPHRMAPGAYIKVHVDSGDWARLTHRIHIPIKINDEVEFSAQTSRGWAQLTIEEGQSFEINNKINHK